MHTWQTAMPRGMKLNSDGFASSLYDPANAFTLERHCAERDLPYQDTGLPVSLETFIEYGLEFQRRFLPDLDTRQVATLERNTNGYSLILDDGEEVWARRVVVATGTSNYSYIPPTLSGVSTGSALALIAGIRRELIAGGAAGKEILIVGAGASAIDLAAMLGQSGASVTIIARRNKIAYRDAPARYLARYIRTPVSGLGTGWRSLMRVKAPLLFHHMPEPFRSIVARKHLGPAPGWVPREYVEKHVAMKLGGNHHRRPRGRRSGRALVAQRGRGPCGRAGDSVIAATGYRPDLRRLTFIGRSVRGGLRCVDHTPILDTQFQSSVPGLYFTGLAAANSFGPLLRFTYGAEFVARRLTDHLHRTIKKNRYVVGVPSVAAAVAG